MSNVNLQIKKKYLTATQQNYWVTSIKHANTITKDDLIKMIVRDSRISKAQVVSVLAAIETEVIQLLCNGHALELSDLGKIFLRLHTSYADSQDEAGAAMVKNAYIKFFPAKEIRQAMDNIKWEVVESEYTTD